MLSADQFKAGRCHLSVADLEKVTQRLVPGRKRADWWLSAVKFSPVFLTQGSQNS